MGWTNYKDLVKEVIKGLSYSLTLQGFKLKVDVSRKLESREMISLERFGGELCVPPMTASEEEGIFSAQAWCIGLQGYHLDGMLDGPGLVPRAAWRMAR